MKKIFLSLRGGFLVTNMNTSEIVTTAQKVAKSIPGNASLLILYLNDEVGELAKNSVAQELVEQRVDNVTFLALTTQQLNDEATVSQTVQNLAAEHQVDYVWMLSRAEHLNTFINSYSKGIDGKYQLDINRLIPIARDMVFIITPEGPAFEKI